MIIYGIMDCPDCAEAVDQLKAADIDFEFRDLGVNVSWLHEFIDLRDTHPSLSLLQGSGQIGIPLFVFPDGGLSLDLAKALDRK